MKISTETKIGFGLMFSISFWAFVDGKLPWYMLTIFPISYGLLYLILWIKFKCKIK